MVPNMKNKKAILKKLKKDLEKLEYKIQNQTRYNIYAHSMQTLIKSGIILEQSLPYIFAAIITYNLGQYCNTTPFFVDKIEINKIIEATETSTGIYHHKIYWNENYKENESMIYTTEWIKNNKGLYERTVITYDLDHPLTEENIKTILELPQDEIENNFKISNIKTIQKNILEPEDELYTEEMLVINYTKEDSKNKKIIDESENRNLTHTAIMIISTLGQAYYIKQLTEKLSTQIKQKLKEKEAEFKPITQKEIENLNQIIKLQKENLKLIEENNTKRKTYTKKRK